MYSVHCTAYNVQRTVYSVQRTAYSVHCTIYTIGLIRRVVIYDDIYRTIV